ncbi:glycosyl hydrolase family 65 protein, partial [Mycetocola reblochoni]|uniref:glycosyl hydrolase family 65 protein n=1 Tax=Mycetocola reblochoni TaxID=331618 RepID=UPI003F9D1D22
MTTTDPDWVLTGTDPVSDSYHPTFTGNGHLGARIPAAGQGFSPAPVPTQFPIAGYYGIQDGFQVRASGPAWTGMPLSDEGGAFDAALAADDVDGRIDDYAQSLDLRTGALRTSARWASPSGAVYDLAYTVIADRADDRRGVVTLEVVADRDAEITVGDVLDMRAATMVARTTAGRDADTTTLALDIVLEGTGVVCAVRSRLDGPGTLASRDAAHLPSGSIAQQRRTVLRAGEPATFRKVVGISTGTGPAQAAVAAEEAQHSIDDAAARGHDELRSAHDEAWRRLWRGDIRVDGDDLLQQQIRASRFYLLASVNARRPFSLSPAGLSSDGYGGHVFWDTETWMWPSLVLQDPELAESVLRYRADRLDDARLAAARGGDAGARFPWEGALDGFEHTPATEFGETELHIVSDVALACWQYYLATGDADWLRDVGGPIISGAADFWGGRATTGDDGLLHIANVTPPDEWAQAHDDSAYTNAAAAAVARMALRTSELTGGPVSAPWSVLASSMFIPHDPVRGVTLEHADYDGARIKQADVVMLGYPWEHEQDDELTARDLDYYASKVTEHGGPSMTDAMHSIVSAGLGRSRDAYWYTKRSADPFLRAPFQQFAEERDGGAFTFVTGAGGFLQEFLYGYSGLRLREDGVVLRPLLPAALDGITLTGLQHRGTLFAIAIGPRVTTVSVQEGPGLTVHSDVGVVEVAAGGSATIPTRVSVDADDSRGHGTRLREVRREPRARAPRPDGALFSAADLELTRVEVFDDADHTRVVATVAGEIANPWAGEAMSAHGLHIYLSDADSDNGVTDADGRQPGHDGLRPGLPTAAPAHWRFALVGSGLEQGGPSGTGLYDASGTLVSPVRLTVARRSEIVLTVPTSALDGVELRSAA